MTRLTIAIPNFNGGEKLKKAITSCKLIKIPQDEFEILVVDNKSTDNSFEIIGELKKEFPNLRLIENQENVGRIQNWTVCIKNCNSKILAKVHSGFHLMKTKSLLVVTKIDLLLFAVSTNLINSFSL